MLDSISNHGMIKRECFIDSFIIPDTFITWIHTHITQPIQGFDHKRNKDGTFYTPSQQLVETRKQAVAIVHDFLKRGKSDEAIYEILRLFC